MHQGDLDKVKGVYHIDVVDAVTQYQFVGSAERISEHYLLPVLESLLEAFPFRLRGFHSNNGSKYVNHRVAELLEKLRVGEFTKSRPRRSNGQRAGGEQERDGDPQASRLRAYPGAARAAAERGARQAVRDDPGGAGERGLTAGPFRLISRWKQRVGISPFHRPTRKTVPQGRSIRRKKNKIWRKYAGGRAPISVTLFGD